MGNELGANRFEEAKKAGKTLIRAAVICGVLTGLLLIALSPLIVRMVAMTPVAEEYLRGMLFMCSYYLAGEICQLYDDRRYLPGRRGFPVRPVV